MLAGRRRHLEALAELFVQVLQLCQLAGLVKLGHIALDGTKMGANASQHKAMSYGRMKQELARLEGEVEQLLARIRQAKASLEAQASQEQGDEDDEAETILTRTTAGGAAPGWFVQLRCAVLAIATSTQSILPSNLGPIDSHTVSPFAHRRPVQLPRNNLRWDEVKR